MERVQSTITPLHRCSNESFRARLSPARHSKSRTEIRATLIIRHDRDARRWIQHLLFSAFNLCWYPTPMFLTHIHICHCLSLSLSSVCACGWVESSYGWSVTPTLLARPRTDDHRDFESKQEKGKEKERKTRTTDTHSTRYISTYQHIRHRHTTASMHAILQQHAS